MPAMTPVVLATSRIEAVALTLPVVFRLNVPLAHALTYVLAGMPAPVTSCPG